MSSLKKLNKFLAGLVAVTFFATNTLTPSPLAFASVEPANTSRFADFKIPSEYGKVVDFAPALISGNLLRDSSFHGRQKDDSRILIHIQEAHANYDAQNNIRNLLKYLAQNYGAKLIFLEGAGGKLQPERLNFFPDDPELQKAVTERLMKAGELTGAEAFLIEKSGDANVQPLASNVSRSEGWGVENVDAYRSNWKLYRSVYQKRETADRFLEDFYLQWRKRASREFDKNLRDFILRYAEYEETKISLEAWIETLKSAAMAHLFLDVPAAEQQTPGKRETSDGPVPSAGMKMPLDLTDVHAQVNWPALVRYFRLKEAGKRIDETKVEIEKAGFLNDISSGNGPFGASRSPALKVTDEVEEIFRSAKTGNLPVHKTRFVFERLMDVLPENFSFDAYPNLRLYIQQIILTSEIDSRMLQSEMKELAKRILESLLKTDREKELVTELREYQQLKKLFHLELSRDEYEREVRRNLTPEKLARLSGAARGDKRPAAGKTVMPAPNSALDVLFSEAIQFYDGAIDREEKMMENAGKILGSRGDKAAVLITGGFHTDGFRKQITESGHSYIGITPNIGNVTREEEENYLRALLGTRGEQVTEKAIIQRFSSNVFPGNIVAPLAGDPDFMRQTLGADYARNRFARIRNLVREVISALRPATSETLWARLDRTLRDLLSPAEMAGARSEARGEDKKLKDQFEDQIQKHQKFIEQKINLLQRDPDSAKKYVRPNMEKFQDGFSKITSFLQSSLRVIRDFESQVKQVYEMTMDWLRSMPDDFWLYEAAPGVAEDAARSVGILASSLRRLDEYGSAITLLNIFIRKTNIRNNVFLLSHLVLAHSSLATRYYAEKKMRDSRAEHLESLKYFALFLPLAAIDDSLVKMLRTVKGTTLPVVFAIGRKDPAKAQEVMEALERVNAAILEVLASSPRLDASIKSSLYEIQIRITEYLTSEQKKKETTVSVQPQEHKKTETVVDLPAQQTSQPRIDKKIRWQQGEEERRKTGASRIQGGQRSFPGDEAAPKRRALEKVKEKLLGLLKAGSEEDRELGKPGLQEEITSLNKPLGQEAVEVLSDFLWRVDEMTTEEQVYQVIDDALARSARSEIRDSVPEGNIGQKTEVSIIPPIAVRDIKTWTQAFELIRWIGNQPDITPNLSLIRQLSLYLRERKKDLRLNTTRDYDQYPDDLAFGGRNAMLPLIRKAPTELSRSIKELALALPYAFSDTTLDSRSTLWGIAEDLDERTLRTKFARDLRGILHGPTFSYSVLPMVRRYINFLETGDQGDGRFLTAEEIPVFLQDGDKAIQSHLSSLTLAERNRLMRDRVLLEQQEPGIREAVRVYGEIKELETALEILFETAAKPDTFKFWLNESFVKNEPPLKVALQTVVESFKEMPFQRITKLINARAVVTETLDKTSDPGVRFSLYHLDRSIGQVMNLSLGTLLEAREGEPAWEVEDALILIRNLLDELFDSGFITRYTVQWSDLLDDPDLSFSQLRDVLGVIEKGTRTEFAKWAKDYHRDGEKIYGSEYKRLDQAIALMRKEKFATTAAMALLKAVKDRINQELPAHEAKVARSESVEKKQGWLFEKITHIDDFKDSKQQFWGLERKVFGGKGTYLILMGSLLGLPVPSAFILPSSMGKSLEIFEEKKKSFEDDILRNLRILEENWSRKMGRPFRYGAIPSDPLNPEFEPLFLSIRSGSVFIMPGISETAVAIGFSPEIYEYILKTRGEQAGYKAFISFVESIGVSLGIPREKFENVIQKHISDARNLGLSYVDERILAQIVADMKDILKDGGVFDQFNELYKNPERQLLSLIPIIFQSWNSPKAKRYRQEKGISDDWHTPVIVQAYVFGDRDEQSGSGTALSHDRTGEEAFNGEWIPMVQGMVHMQGRDTALSLNELEKRDPASYQVLKKGTMLLARHMGVPQMVEFTIEGGKPWFLQTVYDQRVGNAESFPDLDYEVVRHSSRVGGGNVAYGNSGGLSGVVVFNPSDILREDILKKAADYDAVILASAFPTSDDSPDVINANRQLKKLAGKRLIMLTQKGGLTSHAAVVANYEKIPTVVDVQGLDLGLESAALGGQPFFEGDVVTVDFGTGGIYRGRIPQRSESRLASGEGHMIWPFQSVMHIAWEMAPFVKKGGLADVIGELPLAMKRKYPGIDINVIIPYHRDINLGGVVPVSAGTFQYESPEGIQSWEAFKIEHHGLTVFLLQRLSTGHQKFAPLFQKGYQTDNFYEGANFSKAAVEFMAQNNIRPDIIHPHDQTAAHVPVILRDTRDAFFMESAVFYTAHHFAGAYQGKEDLGRARSYLMGLGLSARLFSEGGPVVWGGKFNALRGASLYPDMVSTVSGHFAWEAANSDLSEGLQHVLQPRYVDTKTFLGITNAIDKVMWSSRKGAGIQFPFEASTMEIGKRANKEYLQVKYGLKQDANAPLLSFVSRYDPWVKGFDIVPAVVGELLNNYEELQVVFAGAGDKGVENALADLKKIYPDRVYVSPGFVDADTVRFILAGSDFVGMPSRIEPAGLVQQQGLLLGAVPIVTRVGGLEETVHDPFFTHGIGVQTGFKSNLTDHLAMTFSWACVRALEMFRANKNLLTRIRLDGLDSVSSWDDRVDEYFEAYAIALRNRWQFIHPDNLKGPARSEVRSWAADNVPELAGYTVVSRQMEAGLSRDILDRLIQRYGTTVAGLVAATTITGGLGALMHDLFPSWQKNFGELTDDDWDRLVKELGKKIGADETERKQVDAFAVNVIYDEIKGQRFALDIPEEVQKGQKTLGDYLREVLTEEPDLRFDILLEPGNDFRSKVTDWIGRAGDELYRKRLQQAREAVERAIKVKVYPTRTSVGGMPNFYVEAFYIAADGTKVQIFDELYPDAPHGSPNLWRDLQMAVYGKTTELLTLKLQEKGVVKKDILFVDNEVFASIPTPLLPNAMHHHINHSVFAPTIYHPDESSLELLGYPKTLARYIARDGRISIVDAVGATYDLVTGVALYEHTPAVAGGVMPGYSNAVDSYNEDGLRSTNGVLIEQWQSPLLRGLIDQYKKKLGIIPTADDRDFFAVLQGPGNEATLETFKDRTDMIKAYLTGRLMLWLKESQNRPAWFDKALRAYQEEFGLEVVQGSDVIHDLHERLRKAIQDEAEWDSLLNDPKAQTLRREFLDRAIVSNVRRQVSYKGPDKWREILRILKEDPKKLTWYKENASRAIIGGREFGSDAHELFLEIQGLIRELKLEDLFATIENYNIEVAPIIFHGVSGTVMITYEVLEASATSMMKALPNAGALIGAWGGSEPELFTIINKSTREGIDIFKEKITYEQLIEKLHAGEWEITNGFLVEYSSDRDGKFILYTLRDGEIAKVNARSPDANSMMNALAGLQGKYRELSTRKEIEWESLKSSPLVDMEKSQARAHMKLWQRVIQRKESEQRLFANSYLSPKQALAFFADRDGDTGFIWRKEPSMVLEIASSGVLSFLESARQVRTHGADAYQAVAYHAEKGEIFKKIFSYLDGFKEDIPEFHARMKQLEAEAKKTPDLFERVKTNFVALRLLDRFAEQLSGKILEGYIASRSAVYEPLLQDNLFRQTLYFYLESAGQRFGSLNKGLAGFGIELGGEKYLVALNINETKYPGVDGGEPKAWGQFYGQNAFQWLTGQTDPRSLMTFQVVNAIRGEIYGMGEDKKPYPFWILAEGVFPIGIPAPDIQVLQFRAVGKMEQHERKTQEGSLILDDLRALVEGNVGEQLRQQKPRSYWLKKNIGALLHNDPEELKTRMKTVSAIGKEKAVTIFGAEGVRPVMAFVTALIPDLLEDMKDWDPEVYRELNRIVNEPSLKELFEKGEVSFSDSSRDTAIVVTRTLQSSENEPSQRHVVMPIHFSKFPYNKEEGKVWFGIGSISNLGLTPGIVYKARDWVLQVTYEKEHTIATLLKNGWRVGISVVKRKDPAGIQQTGWRFQVLQMVPVGVNPLEVLPQQKGRSEVRNAGLGDRIPAGIEQAGIDGQELGHTLQKAGHPVTFIDRDMSVETVAERIQNNQVIYLAPPLEVGYDYGKYEEQLIQMAIAKIGPALERVRRHEAGIRKPYERKVFILRGMVDPGTSKAVYDAIKWNAHPPKGDDYDFDLVFQPDFTFLDARTEKTEEPIVVFGVMGEDDGKDAAFQAATKTVLDRIFGQFYQGKKIQYMRIRSAEMSKEMLIIYLGAKLAHFDDVAELSRAYGADLSAAAFGAGLDKRIRTIFTNPSLGFGGRLFVYLHWIYAQRLYKAAAELEGQTHQKLNDRKMEIEQKIRSAVERLERGENITEIVKDLPPQLHLLFTIKTILKINKQNILDFLRSIERAYESMYGSGSLRGKKVALLGVGYSSQSGQITASPALLLIERLIIDEGISEFVIADPDAKAAFMKWVEEKRGENPRFNAVKFEFTDNIYDAAKVSDLTIIPTDSNKALRDIDIKRLGDALQGRPVFDGMNIFGLRADGTYRYKLEDVRDAGINLVGVGRLPLGPELDAQTGYRLGDSVVVRDVAGYRQVLQERGGSVTARQKSVTVIGGGYVGLVTAANLAGLGHRVRVVDIKAKQKEMDALNGPETAVPIYEPGLREMIIDGKAKGLITFSTDLEPAVQAASIVYLAVGTPAQDTGEVDLKYILQASGDIGDAIKKHGGAKTLVVKSTVTPDTFRKMDETLAAKGLKLGKDYALVSNPEFLREGQAIQDVTQPDRTVLGFYAAMSLEDRKRAEKEILELWYPLMLKKEHTVLLTDTASSTIVKYLANSFLAISITLSNLFSSAAEADHADFMEVRMPFKADDRIGGNAFLNAGVGYGGSCFPKDVLALNFSSKDATGHVLPLIDIATGFNEYFKTAVVARTVESVARFPQAARPLEGKSVIMLGMAFKADTDDMREASSASVLHELLVRGATQVRLHDPILSLPNVPPREVILDHFLDTLYKIFRDGEEFQKAYQQHKALLIARGEPVDGEEKNYFKRTYFPEKFIKTGRVVFEPDLGKLGKADIVFLVTEWRQYKGLDLSRFKQTDRKLWVVDGRNLFYDRRDEISQFAEYRGIGTAFFGPRSEAREAFAEVGRMITTKKLRLPKWVGDYSKATRNRVFATPEERMSVAVELSRLNVENGTGGPFGAVVFDRKSGKIFSMGVNLVVPENASFAHAEMVALTLAQERLKNFSLDHDGREFELVTSSQPCAMCFGAIPWSGVKGVVVGARGEDVETITGFDEGPIHPEWDKELLRRGIDVTRDILRDEAIEVLHAYVRKEGTIYNGKAESEKSVRSETRVYSGLEFQQIPEMNYEEFLAWYETQSKASRTAMENLTVEIMQGIAPLLANRFKVIEDMAGKFILNSEPMRLLREKIEADRFEVARKILGVKTVEGYDALVLTKELALDRKGLFAIQKVFGGMPVIILADESGLSDLDRDFISRIPEASRPVFLSAALLKTPGDLSEAVRKSLRGKSSGRMMSLKAMAGTTDAMATLLKRQLKDEVVILTTGMFENFLSVAGVGGLVEQMQAEYLAIVRSA